MLHRQIVQRQSQLAFDSAKTASAEQHSVLQRVFANRNINSSKPLKHTLADLLPPTDLKGIAEAAKVLATAITEQEKILIVGDYDVDGATATAVSLLGLSDLGAEHVSYAVPDRFAYGYGLSEKMATTVRERAPDLVITVDNGISSVAGVAILREAGIDVIVTDHHLPGEHLPDANAIVNPNQSGCGFASKALCGVGVVFYLLLQTRKQLADEGWFDNRPKPALVGLLDLVALGTVADVVPLDKNNRILVSQGIARIRAGQTRPGIKALLESAKRAAECLTTTDLSFGVAPRLNAAGRLADIQTGIECLLASNTQTARTLATELNDINLARREIEQSMQAEAVATVNQMQLDNLIVDGEMGQATSRQPAAIALYQPDWHEGVVGLVASRIKDKTGRPTIIFAPGEAGTLKGSARSIPGVHIRDVIASIDAQHPGLIHRYGGHAMAAGLTLDQADFELFSKLFSHTVVKALGGKEPDHSILTDGALLDAEFDLVTAEVLRTAAPWGQDFPTPLFDNEFQVLSYRVVGENHLKMTVQPVNGGRVVDAIAFRYVEDKNRAINLKRIRAVYQLDVNEYRGNKSVQLIVEYIEDLGA